MGQPEAEGPPPQIDRYQVESQLGAGGVGVVYAAYDPDLERRVAVKLLRSDRLWSDVKAAQKRLREEAQAMARLAHPNVVTVYDVGEHEGNVFIAMELVHGASLREWVDETARPWREVLGMYFQAGLGLAAAHDAGLIHRDFKPGNILVGRDGRARVVDFGLASAGPVAVASTPEQGSAAASMTGGRVTAVETTVDELDPAAAPPPVSETTDVFSTADRTQRTPAPGPDVAQTDLHTTVGGVPPVPGRRADFGDASFDPGATLPTGLTQSGLVAGTPAYMARELFLGRPVDARSDQFSFCVSLYQGLYGRRPFAGTTASQIAEEVVAGRIVAPPADSTVPRWIYAIVERGLQADPAKRHPSVRSILASIAFLARVVWN